MNFPGLSDAMAKIDETSLKLDTLVDKLDRIIELLEEQNNYISANDLDSVFQDNLAALNKPEE